MKADYKNWVPKGMIYGLGAATAGLAGAAVAARRRFKGKLGTVGSAVLGAGAVSSGAVTAWCVYAHNQFSYNGNRKLSKDIRIQSNDTSWINIISGKKISMSRKSEIQNAYKLVLTILPI